MEIDIKFKCGEVRKVYIYFWKEKMDHLGEYYIMGEATFEELYNLGKPIPFNPDDLIHLSGLMRSVAERLAQISADELENKSLKVATLI